MKKILESNKFLVIIDRGACIDFLDAGQKSNLTKEVLGDLTIKDFGGDSIGIGGSGYRQSGREDLCFKEIPG